MKGYYILLVQLDKDSKLKVGKLGLISFNKGYYAYVGSALNGLEERINRHLKDNKRIHWHIDYLLRKAVIRDIFYKQSSKREECKFAKKLKEHFDAIKYFGATDCKCSSHLFYSKNHSQLRNAITELGMNSYRRVIPDH
ncbi:MAG: GIY-YIG nuclease family protein [Candidatus Thermoplasmatota archaeon]|nr:GIY-YIG nuclease family protein [Candidatus Thermoplasmatota archaeon]